MKCAFAQHYFHPTDVLKEPWKGGYVVEVTLLPAQVFLALFLPSPLCHSRVQCRLLETYL